MIKKNFWGMLIIVLAFGIMVSGCDNGSTSGGSNSNGNNFAKTLIIQDVTQSMITAFNNNRITGVIALFNVETTMQQLQSLIGLVADAGFWDVDITTTGNSTHAIVPLYNIGDASRWTGNGTYDVYIIIDRINGIGYKAGSIKFYSETTTVNSLDFQYFSLVSP